MNDARYVEHLPIFLDVARLGSFSAAALGMVPSSLVRHIDALKARSAPRCSCAPPVACC